MLVTGNIMLACLPAQHENALILLIFYLGDPWGHRISLVDFKHIFLESYSYLFCVDYLTIYLDTY
jgi:hypothetical protein